jgi:hypothetical protein
MTGESGSGLGCNSSGSAAGDDYGESEDTESKLHFGNPLSIQIDSRRISCLW